MRSTAAPTGRRCRMGPTCCAGSGRRSWRRTPEQIAGRLRLGIEAGLRAVCLETIYGWIYRAGQKAEQLWRFLTGRRAPRRKASARRWGTEAELVICRRSRPVLVLHERRTRITLMARRPARAPARPSPR
jgi:transposase, IS30 family